MSPTRHLDGEQSAPSPQRPGAGIAALLSGKVEKDSETFPDCVVNFDNIHTQPGHARPARQRHVLITVGRGLGSTFGL